MKITCPHCGDVFDLPDSPAGILGSMTSTAKKKSSAENGKKGGRPKIPRTGEIFTLEDYLADPRAGTVYCGVRIPYIRFKDDTRSDVTPELVRHIKKIRKNLEK